MKSKMAAWAIALAAAADIAPAAEAAESISCGAGSLCAAEPAPPWTAGLAMGFRYGGRSGSACWAIKLSGHALVVPDHCAPSGQGMGSSARDYRIVEQKGLAGEAVGSVQWAKRSAQPNALVWVASGPRWVQAKVLAASGSSYWLSGKKGAMFCPGDSGAAVWESQGGRMAWIGMLVSGGEPSGCSKMGTAVKAQAIDLSGGGSERF